MSRPRIPFVDLPNRVRDYEDELTEAFLNVLHAGAYVMGPEVEAFETELAKICGVKHVLGVGNGTDAIVLALRALDIGPGDEVITAPNSFIASAGAVQMAGAAIRFADVGEDYNIDPDRIRAAITPRTKAILPVHLTGRPAQMDAILDIARAHDLAVIEDAAQAIGAKHHGRPVGSLGDVACFSLHPLKNLHVFGDGGFVTTDDPDLHQRMARLRNHGLVDRDTCAEWGQNSRLDTLQAALGLVQLKRLDAWTERYRAIATQYRDGLRDVVQVPEDKPHEFSVYHNFVVLAAQREALMAHLQERGIDTKIHYPLPLHRQPAADALGLPEGSFPVVEAQAKTMLSLPIYPELTDVDVDQVVAAVRDFYASVQPNLITATS